MKNKKLFAILTLVCFMMTLMPVAAFAATSAVAVGTYAANGDINLTVTGYTAGEEVIVVPDGKVGATTVDLSAGYTPLAAPGATTVLPKAQVSADNTVVVVAAGSADAKSATTAFLAKVDITVAEVTASDAAIVAAANAAIDYETSLLVATDGSDSYYANDAVNTVLYTVKLRDAANTHLTLANAAQITIWAEEVSKPGITSSALKIVGITNPASAGTVAAKDATNQPKLEIANAEAWENVAYDASVELYFQRPGEYRVFATATSNVNGATVGDTPSTTVSGVIKLLEVGDVISVSSSATVRPEVDYTASASKVSGNATFTPVAGTVTEGNSLGKITGLAANNINDIAVKVDFDCLGQDLVGKTVAIDTNSANVNVSKASATTNALGAINFAVSAAREGNYKIYLTVDGCTWTIDVECGNTAAAYIAVEKAPTALVALYGTAGNDKDLDIQVYVTDINGNAVLNAGVASGINNATTNVGVGKYVSFTAKPAASKLTSKDLNLTNLGNGFFGLTLNGKMLDAEGAYEVKIVLDNGNYVTVPFTVKEFQTPVRLILAYPQSNIELGGTLAIGKLAYMDANGVMKVTETPTLAATGHAIADFTVSDPSYLFGRGGIGVVTVKSDEKYVGSKVTVTAVDDRYDLVATATLTVADEAAGLAFENNTVEVGVNNKITVNVVDSQGNKVALGENVMAKTDISYVVLDKPEGAKVSVYTVDDSKLALQGKFVMALTADTVGTVKVQAVVKLTTANDGVNPGTTTQVKYYTGVQEFAVGTGETGKSVVMSIGSNELIVGSKVEKMDAKPMIKENRTFVPFRALAEAFGATVAYDQATSAVTAELNGVKVVMTVGAPVYTVNGVEKNAGVAPFISDSRTFVPVRFAAEAFGIEVVPTYNEDGSVADVLFNM